MTAQLHMKHRPLSQTQHAHVPRLQNKTEKAQDTIMYNIHYIKSYQLLPDFTPGLPIFVPFFMDDCSLEEARK